LKSRRTGACVRLFGESFSVIRALAGQDGAEAGVARDGPDVMGRQELSSSSPATFYDHLQTVLSFFGPKRKIVQGGLAIEANAFQRGKTPLENGA
jgi:hypothetical protein